MNGSFKSIWLGSTVPRGWRGLVDLSDWVPSGPSHPITLVPYDQVRISDPSWFLGNLPWS